MSGSCCVEIEVGWFFEVSSSEAKTIRSVLSEAATQKEVVAVWPGRRYTRRSGTKRRSGPLPKKARKKQMAFFYGPLIRGGYIGICSM
jgi:hypothetical protein